MPGRRRPIVRRSARDHAGYVGSRGLGRHRICRSERPAGSDLLGGSEAVLDHQIFEANNPQCIIAQREIFGRRNALARLSKGVQGPRATRACGIIERENAPLPLGVKDRLVRLDLHRAEAMHAAHICCAVHRATSSTCLGNPVPIMLSRVTRSARRSSLQPSVAAGRIGTTR